MLYTTNKDLCMTNLIGVTEEPVVGLQKCDLHSLGPKRCKSWEPRLQNRQLTHTRLEYTRIGTPRQDSHTFPISSPADHLQLFINKSCLGLRLSVCVNLCLMIYCGWTILSATQRCFLIVIYFLVLDTISGCPFVYLVNGIWFCW